MTTTLHITPEIIDFARGVREHLADLPSDEVDDLTDGLEADMAEAYAENPGHALPEPEAYALELRNAAGLPVRERSPGSIGRSFRGVAESIRMKREGVVAKLRGNPFGAGALDLLIELRPAWWIARAVAAYMFGRAILSGSLFPNDLLELLVLLALIVVSVQWGRGRWMFRGLRPLIVVGNVLAVALAIPLISQAESQTLTSSEAREVYGYEPEYVDEAMAGVTLNGNEVTNIFAYDADGKALKRVQLFDQDGHPLATSVPGGNGCLDPECVDEGVWVSSMLETGAKAWNVFPMQMALVKFEESTGELVPDPSATPQDRPAPFLKVPGLLAPEKAEKADAKVEKDNG